MAANKRTEIVDTSVQQQLVERNNGLVREVQMLRQHITGMYQAWTTGKAPPPPPPIFLDTTLVQTPNITPGDPPYSPDSPAYHTHPSVTTAQDCPPVIDITPNNEHPLEAHNAQYHSPEIAHRVSDSNKKSPQDEFQTRNEPVTGRDGILKKLKSMDPSLKDKRRTKFKMPCFNLYDGHGDPVAHLRVYCNEMRNIGEEDDVMIAYFPESLTGAALDWYGRRNVDEWPTLSDMVRDFV